jgi:hypothetical protein
VLYAHPTRPHVAVSAGMDGYIILWDLTRGVPFVVHDTLVSQPGGGCDAIQVLDGRWRPDGDGLAFADQAGQLLIFGIGRPAPIMLLTQYDQFYKRDFGRMTLSRNPVPSEIRQGDPDEEMIPTFNTTSEDQNHTIPPVELPASVTDVSDSHPRSRVSTGATSPAALVDLIPTRYLNAPVDVDTGGLAIARIGGSEPLVDYIGEMYPTSYQRAFMSQQMDRLPAVERPWPVGRPYPPVPSVLATTPAVLAATYGIALQSNPTPDERQLDRAVNMAFDRYTAWREQVCVCVCV